MDTTPTSLIEFTNKWRSHQPTFYSEDPNDSKKISESVGYLPLDLGYDIPYQEMLEEARSIREHFVIHRGQENHSGWRSICIHGLGHTHTLGHKDYGYNSTELAPYRWTDICDRCPVTYNFFKNVLEYESYERIRFMLLEPGGYIVPHIDVPFKYLGPLNMALNEPTGCEFVMENWGKIPFPPGAVNILAIGHLHAVWNNSNEDRYHIIVHGIKTPVWQQRIIDSYLVHRNIDHRLA
jgi:Aspartyl/Asparaginyl beta-hydroxylase